MMSRSIRATTALAATLSLLLPQVTVVPVAWAQEGAAAEEGARMRLCLGEGPIEERQPPCPRGQPRRGTVHILTDGQWIPRPPGQQGAAEAEVEEVPEDGEAEAMAAEEAEAEAEAIAEEEARARAEAEERAAEEAEAEARAAEEAEAQAIAEEEARARAEAEDRAAEEAEAEAQARAEAEAAAQAEAEAQAAVEEEAAAEAQDRSEAEAEAEAGAEVLSEAEAQAQAEADAARQAIREQRQTLRDAAREAGEADQSARREARQRARAEADAEAAAALEAAARAEAEAEAAREALRAERRERRQLEAALAAANEGEGESGEVEVETFERADVRSATEDFETEVSGQDRAEDDDDELSDLEKLLLLGLGAAAVGAVLNNGEEVVSNSGDRVVTRGEAGNLAVYRDDDAILYQEGATVRTETYEDGSTRTILEREDGTQVVTIRDATGRVLRRARVLPDGTQILLFDDLEEVEPVNVMTLLEEAPPPVVVDAQSLDIEELRELLAEEPEYDAGRDFSLGQIRDISAVRNLMPAIDLDVNFPTGSAAIPGDELSDLVEMGILIEDALVENPYEVFLVEGHTDAVGSDAYNLALSDRRAESVALALSENFEIPPENIVVQGYGESYLKVPTETDEEANRRATIRRITPLLGAEVAAAD